MPQYVAYYRVSTQKQGASGLGLEAQQEAVRRFVGAEDEVAASFTEVESGKRSDRPQLILALADAKRLRATLLIAKLDRLSRDVLFIATLLKGDVPIKACDMPNANNFQFHIMAAVAEHEAQAISDRTKAALAAAKARGVKLGGFRGFIPDNVKQREDAAAFAERLRPTIEHFRSQGVVSFKGLARQLNASKITTSRGAGLWSAKQVARVLQRIDRSAPRTLTKA
jgi:DNA invertase Pin-like site-specific DNA recombinase